MLLKVLIWKFFSVIFAFSFIQFSIWANNYTTMRLTETFNPVLGWIKNIDYGRSFENAIEVMWDYSGYKRHGDSSNNELDIYHMRPRVQDKVDVPGIIYEQVPSAAPSPPPPKCTWRQRLGFQFPLQSHPPVAPSMWNFLSAIASHWPDSATRYAKWLRSHLRCSYMKRWAVFIRSYLPWEPNPAMELLALWTIFATFIIGLNIYDIMILRSKEQDHEDWRYDGQDVSEQCSACMQEKMREIFPQIKLLDED